MEHQGDNLVLGIDLGGTKILSSVIDENGEMLARDHSVTPATSGQEAVVQAMVESVHQALSQLGMDMSGIQAVGIGAPGPSNPETGMLFASPNLPGWKDVPIRDIMEEQLGKKTFLINDANAAAVGEFYFGAAKDVKHAIYVTVSTGIGGGIVIDGKLLTGAAGTAAEIGHMTIDDKGPLCNCGNHGCWETLASGTALARKARERIGLGAETSILELASGDVGQVTAKIIQMAAEAGDALAAELIADNAYYLGVGFANLLNIFNPEMIVIGGGLSNIGDRLLVPAYEEAARRAYTSAYEAVRFAPAALGRNSGVLGAAAHAVDMLKEQRPSKVPA
jgi:glucokinase